MHISVTLICWMWCPSVRQHFAPYSIICLNTWLLSYRTYLLVFETSCLTPLHPTCFDLVASILIDTIIALWHWPQVPNRVPLRNYFSFYTDLSLFAPNSTKITPHIPGFSPTKSKPLGFQSLTPCSNFVLTPTLISIDSTTPLAKNIHHRNISYYILRASHA
jgi:hypothetical protein